MPEGKTVTFSGANSLDPDGALSSVQWEQIEGNHQVALTAPATGPEGDILTFKLSVRDGDDLVSSDNVTINVTAVSAAASNGGGGCFIQSVSN